MKFWIFQKIKSCFSKPHVLQIPTTNKKRLKSELKERNFIHNGAVLLQKQIESFGGEGVESIRIYSEDDIYHGTNGYDPSQLIGRKIATVYRGIIDDQTVAIKTPEGLHGSIEMIDFFLNQVTIKQQINHRNVVQLFGCCLETHIPMLVFEYMHGNLFDYLHNCKEINSIWISWKKRLQIATETAYALSYMHCGTSKPIVHRNVKSASVFLDESISAKLSNFGLAISINPDKEKPMWPPVGSFGYIDPEYIETLLVTEKCDVYSLGVLMVELLTGKDPKKHFEEDSNLADYFVSSMMHDSLLDIIDWRLKEEGSVKTFQLFAELAGRCVQMQGERRPTMVEVVLELRRIQTF